MTEYQYYKKIEAAEEEFHRMYEEAEERLEYEFNEAVEPLVKLMEEYWNKREVYSLSMTRNEFKDKIIEMVKDVL